MRAEERRESILAAAGITQPMLYRHFKSKHELLLTCLECSAALVQAAWREVPDLSTMGERYLTLTAAGIDGVSLRMQAMAEASDERSSVTLKLLAPPLRGDGRHPHSTKHNPLERRLRKEPAAAVKGGPVPQESRGGGEQQRPGPLGRHAAQEQ